MTEFAVARPRKLAPDGVLGMLIFVGAESMYFAGLISAHVIVSSRAPAWPPLGQPRLPFEQTALNTTLLLLSGVLLFLAHRAWKRERRSALSTFAGAIVLGSAFVGLQGREWIALIREGLTLTSSTYGGFFYLIVGSHGLHAVVGLGCLVWAWFRLRADRLPASALGAVQVLWFFVVALWPFLYLKVY